MRRSAWANAASARCRGSPSSCQTAACAIQPQRTARLSWTRSDSGSGSPLDRKTLDGIAAQRVTDGIGHVLARSVGLLVATNGYEVADRGKSFYALSVGLLVATSAGDTKVEASFYALSVGLLVATNKLPTPLSSSSVSMPCQSGCS